MLAGDSRWERHLGWVKLIPAWVWLLLAAWLSLKSVFRLSFGIMIGPTSLLPVLGALVFFTLAGFRIAYWSRPEAEAQQAPSARDS